MERRQTAILQWKRKSLEKRSLFIRVIDEELEFSAESHLPIDHRLIQPSHTPAYAAKSLIQTACSEPSSEWSVLWSEHAVLRWENLLQLGSIARRRHSAEAELQGVPAKPYKHGCVPCMYPSLCRLQGHLVYEKNENAKGTTLEACSSLSVVFQGEVSSRWWSLSFILCCKSEVSLDLPACKI